jgi:hypothetical protein
VPDILCLHTAVSFSSECQHAWPASIKYSPLGQRLRQGDGVMHFWVLPMLDCKKSSLSNTKISVSIFQ